MNSYTICGIGNYQISIKRMLYLVNSNAEPLLFTTNKDWLLIALLLFDQFYIHRIGAFGAHFYFKGHFIVLFDGFMQ